MGRKRLSDEEILKKWGTIERYENHLKAMKRWGSKHPDRNHQYYWENRVRERARTKKYREEHPEYAQSLKIRTHEMIQTDPVIRERNKIRQSSRSLADRLGIDRKGKELHHPEPMKKDHFIVLEKEKHRLGHHIAGGKNKNLDLQMVKDLLPILGDVILVIDGKITNWEEV